MTNQDIEESLGEAEEIIRASNPSRQAKFIPFMEIPPSEKAFEGDEATVRIVSQGGVIGRYEGRGFANDDVCPDKTCEHFKYTGGKESLCTHPNYYKQLADDIDSGAIGGMRECPMSILQIIWRGIRKKLGV